MMKRSLFAVAVAAILLGTAPQSRAALIYSNGPINGGGGGFTANPISGGASVSDSFLVTGSASLTGVQFGNWNNIGTLPLTVDWAIGTTPFANDVASGTGATLTNTYFGSFGGSFDIYSSTFAITGAVTAGTYWLTLSNLQNPTSTAIGWDINHGPNQSFNPPAIPANGLSGHAFQINGDPSAVPEPTSIVLFGMGAVGLVGTRLRRKKLAATQTAAA